jgi:hypothetical protein
MSSSNHSYRIGRSESHSLFNGELVGSGSRRVSFVLDSDSLLVSLYVRTLTSGTLDVYVLTYTSPGEDVEIIRFPQITAPTTDLLLKKSADTMSNSILVIEYTGSCNLQVVGRGMGSGTTSARILGATELRASPAPVTTTPALLIPAALVDRAGIVIKNNTPNSILYIGFKLAEATTTIGYPMGGGECIGIDIEAGQEIYAVGSTSIDVRLIEATS